MPQPTDPDFDKERLSSSVVAIPLLEEMGSGPRARKVSKKRAGARGARTGPALFNVIIDLQLRYPHGRAAARKRVEQLVDDIQRDKAAVWQLAASEQGLDARKNKLSQQYLFGRFDKRFIEELIRRDRNSGADGPSAAIHRIWPDFPVKALTDRSISTVKADAAHNAFSCTGEGIVWAVLDSGIDALHPHFEVHDNLNLSNLAPLEHLDFTSGGDNIAHSALIDRFGHGTHVAGIIAGQMTDAGKAATHNINAVTRVRDESGEVREQVRHPTRISGMAPCCKLLSMKVLDETGSGLASSLIAALEHVQQLNNHGRYLRVHGVNLSVGYSFDPEWFACGQSPLCVEVDRLVKSGVVVVVAAGNTGYGTAQTTFKGAVAAGIDLTINDPGNADLAITVGSTHRDMPHVYGVSYFSSKGPTGDGRSKPDLVAPGEKIVSCDAAWRLDPEADPDTPAEQAAKVAHLAALQARVKRWTPAPAEAPTPKRRGTRQAVARYREDSGTSMAAPHVSGVIAAFLSVRREFVGQPEKVKELFVDTATDLRRERYFQGAGLVDLMRAIQSV
jgi:subtilisin family serine protease